MNWEAIGAVGEILGAIAVVLSLVYLATQIRVSNRVAQRDSRMNLLQLSKGFWSGAADSPTHAKVRVALRQTDPELSPEEGEVARDWAQHAFFTIAAVMISAESNTISEATFDLYLNGFADIFSEYPGLLPLVRPMPGRMGIGPGYSARWDKVLELFN